MKIRIAWVIVASAIAAFGFGSAYAFHDGGVAECTGCHSMHSAASTDMLLIGSDQSSTCLSCHEHPGDTGPSSYHISTPQSELLLDTDVVKQRTPGGDFGWLRQDLSAPASYSAFVTINNYGYERGHSIQAADNGYTFVDGVSSPGGSAPADELSCVSCHDPHSRARRLTGNTIVYPNTVAPYEPIIESGSYGADPAAGEAVGVYRLLGGANYAAWSSGPTFPGNPAAVVPSTYNRTEATTQTRVAYGFGNSNGYASWSAWCGTCHNVMHNPGSSLVHETEQTLGSEATIYNQYVMTGNLTGNAGTSFTSLVPYAMDDDDPANLVNYALNDDSDLSGPAGTDRILCLTCHRAHASGWKYALRWNMEAEFLTLADAGGNPIYPGVELAGTIGNQGQFNQGYTSTQMSAAYYDRPATVFSQHQRALCNKCHAKD